MQIDYKTCDICKRKIDTDKIDKAMCLLKAMITKKMRLPGEKKEKTGPALFDTKHFSDLPKTQEYLEEISIDLCEDHTTDVLKYITNARKTKDKAKGKK